MQEKELRFDLFGFLDDLETAIVNGNTDLAIEDIKEYREYLRNTTKIEASDLQD